MSNHSEELQRLNVEMRILEETAKELQARINMMDTLIVDVLYSTQTLEGLEQNGKNSELLVPIGGKSYIKAQLQETDQIIVNIGAGVSIEKSLQETKEIVQTRSENLEKNRKILQQQFAQIIQKIRDNRKKLEKIVSEGKKEN